MDGLLHSTYAVGKHSFPGDVVVLGMFHDKLTQVPVRILALNRQKSEFPFMITFWAVHNWQQKAREGRESAKSRQVAC